MPVLITSGLSPEAWRLQRILGTNDVVFCDESQMPGIPGIRSIVLPTYSSGSYIHETLKACLDYNIDRVYPLKQGEVLELSKARDLYSEYNIRLVIPSGDWLKENHSETISNAANITVVEEYVVKAGSLPPGELIPPDGTGIFCWATGTGKIQYSLYII
ncbi:hypothetical protein [Daejeonella sp. JGW-45]|uniref:hypothetical protein n=1 Tax=Daejeonella sp. JGW-45 TaxID=3034148 RepID=UPI0023EA815A|nr:hypothetical protein [Daejeonella sp. JGW-45]